MKLDEEFLKILDECEDKSYIKSKADFLKLYFSKTENLDMLKHILTTKRCTVGIKIIGTLKLKVIPFLEINQYTYYSIYWLNKIKVITTEDFLAMKNKFMTMENSSYFFESVERNYMMAQIEDRRKSYKDNKSPSSVVNVMNMGFKPVLDSIFFINLDGLLEWENEEIINLGISEKLSLGFKGNAKSKSSKISKSKLSKIYSKLGQKCKNGAKYKNLSASNRKMIDLISSAQIKLLKCGIKCFLYNKVSLNSLLLIGWKYFYNIDIKYLISTSKKEIESTDKRTLFFGKDGIPLCLLKRAVSNCIFRHEEKIKSKAKNT